MNDGADDALRRFVEALEKAGVPYMLTGSFASAYHGQSRASQDIDFIITPTREQLRDLVSQFTPPDYYVDERAAQEALRETAQFNAIDWESGLKADFIFRKTRQFSEEEFGRRFRVIFGDIPVTIATAEDVIISKLEWAKLGSSDRQISDAAGILQVRGDGLDRAYIERWIGALGLDEQWSAALHEAGIE